MFSDRQTNRLCGFFCLASSQLYTFNYSSKKKTLINVSGEIAASFFFFRLTKLVVGGRMLYRPLLLLLLLILLHSSFNVKHLTMNSFAPMMVYILFLPFFFSFYFECMLLFGLCIGQTVILGVKEENIAHILSILISTCRCGDVGNHLRSSPLFYILSFRSKVVVMPFFPAFRVLFVFCFFSFFLLCLSLSLSTVRSA